MGGGWNIDCGGDEDDFEEGLHVDEGDAEKKAVIETVKVVMRMMLRLVRKWKR